ncbi:MAG: hypothetical protein ABUT20_56590 [Bacteroidota bacterium]
MKKLLTALFIVLFPVAAHAQEAKPQLLKEPVHWLFERFELPPSFAPAIVFKGAEELRFSPGMFKKDSADYFSYAFVSELDNTTSVSQNDIQNYLLNYFKGLCSVTAKDRKLVIDTSAITVAVERKNEVAKNEVIYNALLNIFGVFADGAPLKLNMEVKVLPNTSFKKTYLIFITSPREKTDKIWNELYAIQKNFIVPS